MAALCSLLGTRSTLWLTLIALVLAIRVLVPAGWMVAAGPGGAVLVPCSGMGPATVTPAHDTGHGAHRGVAQDDAPAHQDTAGNHPCAFAGIGQAIGTPFASVIPALALPRATPSGVRFTVAVGHGLAAPPPPQTGPPRLT